MGPMQHASPLRFLACTLPHRGPAPTGLASSSPARRPSPRASAARALCNRRRRPCFTGLRPGPEWRLATNAGLGWEQGAAPSPAQPARDAPDAQGRTRHRYPACRAATPTTARRRPADRVAQDAGCRMQGAGLRRPSASPTTRCPHAVQRPATNARPRGTVYREPTAQSQSQPPTPSPSLSPPTWRARMPGVRDRLSPPPGRTIA